MIKTYNRSLFHRDISNATVELTITENVKSEGEDKNAVVATYTGVKSWSIIDGEDAEEIERETDDSGIDEHHEYLRLNFVNGETATFRNSHTTMFIYE